MADLDENFTPKQIAQALQVSESSVKRWCDRGVIRSDRTLGGHRRIPLNFLIEFLEATNRRLVDPSAIGLGAPVESFQADSEQPDSDSASKAALQAHFERSLIRGNEDECRKVMSTWFAIHGGMASVSDDLLAPTFQSVGQLWECGDVDVFQERRGCEICSRLIHEMRRLIQDPTPDAPLAMGGTCPGDNYQIANQLIDISFRETGWRTICLGSNVPFASLLAAARKHVPKVFWLSVSYIADEATFLAEYSEFAQKLPKGVMLVVGGRALHDQIRPKMTYAAHCDNMHQLTSLARSLKPSNSERN